MNYYHEEDVLGKAYDSRLMRRLFSYVKPYRVLLILGIVASLSLSAIELALPYVVKIAIDQHIVAGDYSGIFRISLVYMALLMGSFGFDYAKIYFLNLLGQKAMRDLRMEIFNHVQGLSLRFFDKNPLGRLVTRVTSDVQVLNELFASGVVAAAGDAFLLLGIIGLMLYVNWRLALTVFITLPFLTIAANVFRIRIRGVYRDIRARLARLNAYLHENLSGMRAAQAYGRTEKNYEDFLELNGRLRRSHLQAVSNFAMFFPVVGLISDSGAALLVWFGGGSVIKGAVTIGTLVLFLQYMRRFFQPIRDLSEKFNMLQSAMASSERIFRLLDTGIDVPEPEDPAPPPELVEGVDFRNVWFAYENEEFVLKDVSFSVKKGETAAIVGATGAGKTSIINLLCRFYDYSGGEILIDGTELKRFRSRDLRGLIGLVLQDVFLFHGSVTDNIRLGNHDISDEDVERAARIVNAHDFIKELPGGYEHMVLERGAGFSQGQRQLLAFARALAFDPKLLILDEATSNIDTATEQLIQDALSRLLKGRTSIVIAHRLSTIRNADKIIALHKGRVREVGTHQELLRKGGLYYKLYELQYRHMADGEEEK